MKKKLEIALAMTIFATPVIAAAVVIIKDAKAHKARQKELQLQIDARKEATILVLKNIIEGKYRGLPNQAMDDDFQIAVMEYRLNH